MKALIAPFGFLSAFLLGAGAMLGLAQLGVVDIAPERKGSAQVDPR